jgi:hypothetical protein
VTANVVCVGQLYAVEAANGPCGWTGARKPHPAYGKPTKTLACPRCGGRVEVLDPDTKAGPFYPELADDLKRAGQQMARYKEETGQP